MRAQNQTEIAIDGVHRALVSASRGVVYNTALTCLIIWGCYQLLAASAPHSPATGDLITLGVGCFMLIFLLAGVFRHAAMLIHLDSSWRQEVAMANRALALQISKAGLQVA